MHNTELLSLTLEEGSRLLAEGLVSSEELTKKYIARIKEHDAVLNCFITLDQVGALAAAKESDKRRQQHKTKGPLDGVPLALKDIIKLIFRNIMVIGDSLLAVFIVLFSQQFSYLL